MQKTLYWKFILAFALIAIVTAGLVAIFIRLTSADRLSQLIVDQQRSYMEQALKNYYVTNGSWQGIEQSWRQIQFQSFPRPEPPSTASPFLSGGREEGGTLIVGVERRQNFLGLADQNGVVIVSVDPQYPTGSQLPADIVKAGTSISVNGSQVGTIVAARQPPGFNPQETLYLRRTTVALVYAIVGSLIVALVLGNFLARTLTRPVRALTRAAHNITQGNLEQQVQVTSNDEIGQLAGAFNTMSREVARVNQMRKQMTADIAHDLRTPLTVISGYIEAMRDGVLKPTPQRLDLIYTEIERLQNLVGDLRMLSLADSGDLSLNPQTISAHEILSRAATLFCHQAEQRGIIIEVQETGEPIAIRVDEARMMQVLENLISNSLRYTPSGGKITLAAQASEGMACVTVADTGEGIAAEELPNLFNRFHRVDKSRHAEAGESGLGLAIVKALVELQGGKVAAQSNSGLGTTIQLFLPVDPGPV